MRSAPFFEPDPLERVSGPSSSGKPAKTQTTNYNFYYLLRFAYSVLLNLSFSYGPQNCHEMTLELVHGADFVCLFAPSLEPDPIKGVLEPTLAKKWAQKPKLKFKF